MKYYAAAAFAMESVAAAELRALGMRGVHIEGNRVFFEGDEADAARACVFLRSVDRIFLLAGRFTAVNFDELFAGTEALPWAQLLARDGKFLVSARCVQSALMSQSDVQSVAKKAIIKKMQKRYAIRTFPETGAAYRIDFSVYKNEVVVGMDLCGEGLHRRGYRVLNAQAPLRETFAAGLLLLAGYRGDRSFADPFCGSGTLAIEAAMIAAGRAPGMNRRFDAEAWQGADPAAWLDARQEAAGAVHPTKATIYAADVDPKMTEMTHFHAKRAGVEALLTVRCRDARQTRLQQYAGVMVTNPPYGDRLFSPKQAAELMRQMRGPLRELAENAWTVGILTPDQQLEAEIGLRAKEKRRLFNADIPCRFYLFPGQNST